jgi:2-C-methyl-D-erythritol 2,4-cyclodiphosphate synthase
MRDIGYHFPDTGKEYEGIDSKILLQRTYALLQQKGYRLGNADCIICAQAPKLSPHIDKMRECIAHVLHLDIDCISIKATTTERLGFVGRKEGIAAYATVLIIKD